MTDAELQGQVTTLLLAGFETTSTTLTWSLYILAKHPKIQQKLRDEIRQARKAAIEKGQEEIESEDLASLEYLDAFTVSLSNFVSSQKIIRIDQFLKVYEIHHFIKFN